MGVARIFQRGGHTDSYIGYSPNCHLNIVGCLLTKRLTKGGSRAPQDPPPPGYAHANRDRNPKFALLSETTSIPVCFIWESSPWNIKSFPDNCLSVLPDLDPCIDVTCHYHCLCKAFGPNDARCVAVDSCPSYQEPVCSSNGTTYDNECLFRQEMCIQRLNFSVQHPGSCEG